MSITADQFFQSEQSRLSAKQSQADNLALSQQRLTLLNDSYRKRYAKYVQIIMVLVLAVVIYLGMSTIKKTVSFSPPVIFDALYLILIFAIAYYLWGAFTMLRSRNPTNFDELNVAAIDYGNGVDAQAILNNVNNGQLSLASVLGASGECVGNDCCPVGYSWDQTTNKCEYTMPGNATGSAIDPATGSKATYTSTTDGNGSEIVTYTDITDGFTTIDLEYSKLDQKEVKFDDPSLKRSPNVGTMVPTYVGTSLEFSKL